MSPLLETTFNPSSVSHRGSPGGSSTSPPLEAPVCRWGLGWACSGSCPPYPPSSVPARLGGRAAAPPAAGTGSPPGRRWSLPTGHPAGWRIFSLHRHWVFFFTAKVWFASDRASASEGEVIESTVRSDTAASGPLCLVEVVISGPRRRGRLHKSWQSDVNNACCSHVCFSPSLSPPPFPPSL